MVTPALRVPLAVGVKLTLMAQDAFTASVLEPVGQLLVAPKSPAFVPVSVMLLMLSGTVPLLVTVIV